MVATEYHIPVLLPESVSGLAVRSDGIYVDLTFGGGGHSREILSHLQTGTLIAFDQDPAVTGWIIRDPRFRFVGHNFRWFGHYLEFMGYDQVDGILADLGLSSGHLDNPERGFSFRYDAPLDMRMSPGLQVTAADILREAGEQELLRIFRDYGELEQAARIVRSILAARAEAPLETTFALAGCVRPLFPSNRENKLLAQVFQALRIAVNDEMENLDAMLREAARRLKPGGRLVVISYHSLEDRLVKNHMRAGTAEGAVQADLFGNIRAPFRPISRKAITPGPEETERNSRARSARLRIAERTDYQADVQ